MTREEAFSAITAERGLQDSLYDPPDGSSTSEMVHALVLGQYMGKLNASVSEGDTGEYRRRLIQIAALAVQGLESIRRGELEDAADFARRIAS